MNLLMPPPRFAQIGDFAQIAHGDCLELLPLIPDGSVDMVLTDPPYSSGGLFRGDRMRPTSEKYSDASVYKKPDFYGDNRDQRAFFLWCRLWVVAVLSGVTRRRHGGSVH